MPFLREDMCDLRVSVDGVALFDSWATVEGANLEADDSKTRAGGMGREVSVGGPASRSDATATIQFSDIVNAQHKRLESLVGTARVKIGYTFLNAQRTPTGSSHSVVGTLKAANLPDLDANSSDVAFYTIVVSCDEQAA